MDHPRTRGVYSSTERNRGMTSGSSPHARGLLGALDQQAQGPRIIPARAGFTVVGVLVLVGAGDHPRTRGVYIEKFLDVSVHLGSSPHARGLRSRAVYSARAFRIIPARAGFTSAMSVAVVRVADHPRTRGVYLAVDPA